MHRKLGFDARTLSKLLPEQRNSEASVETVLHLFATLWAYAALLYADEELERERAAVARVILQLVLLLFPPHPVVMERLKEDNSPDTVED